MQRIWKTSGWLKTCSCPPRLLLPDLDRRLNARHRSRQRTPSTLPSCRRCSIPRHRLFLPNLAAKHMPPRSTAAHLHPHARRTSSTLAKPRLARPCSPFPARLGTSCLAYPHQHGYPHSDTDTCNCSIYLLIHDIDTSPVLYNNICTLSSRQLN